MGADGVSAAISLLMVLPFDLPEGERVIAGGRTQPSVGGFREQFASMPTRP